MLASVGLALSLAVSGPGEACDPGPPLVAEANDESVPLSSRLQVLEDARHELTLEQVASPPACTRFLRPERLETRGGSRYWLRLALELRGDQARGWLLFLDVSNFERACVHWPLATGGHATRCASVGAPGGVGSVRHNRLVYSVPRELDPLRPSFLELDSRAPQALRGRLVRPERFLEEDLPVQFASGLFNGLLFATVLYNLIFFVAARDRVNLFFAIHLLALALAMLGFDGRGREHLWPWLGAWGAAVPAALLSTSFLFGCLYGRDYLLTATRAPRLDALLRLAMLPAACGIVASFASVGVGERIAALAALAFVVSLVSAAAVLARRGFGPALYLLVGLSILLVGLLSESLRVLGVSAIPDEWGAPVARAGMVFASIAISAGLGRRVVELRGERDRAEKEVTQLEESLRRRERMAAMGSLVAGVAHEVRNPLFGISSTVDALEARVKPEGVAHHLGMLRSQVERLGKLMDDLLEYGRPRALERRPEPLAAMVDEASRACDFLARAAGSRVELVARDDVPTLPVDRKRIVQVLQNVLENALRHAPADSAVTVELARLDGDGSLVRIAVRDRGPGFAIPDLPHVFEPFFTRRQGGTGLGLSIVQQIVEQHGGRVEARNHPAGGAEVVILLPAAEG
jgi:signal transduction histidine kinase